MRRRRGDRGRGIILTALIFGAVLVIFGLLIYLPDGEGKRPAAPTPVYEDPHKGMTRAFSADGGFVWIPLYEELETNAYREAGVFSSDGAFVDYESSGVRARRGVDVSEHQGEIDWAAVSAQGVEFAIIRAGYRGYSEGALSEDAFFRKNIEGALANGLEVGVYFFSQAVSITEALEEADFALSLIEGYEISLPVVFDWEHIGTEPARTDDVSGETATRCALSFVWRVEQEGYTPAVYMYSSLAYSFYDLGAFEGMELWIAEPASEPWFYYDFSMWQYSCTARIDGIATDVDLNLRFEKD